jgi:glycosyltransferase involved in cell wall biosynthesis
MDHHRSAYDLWGTPYQEIPNTPEGVRIRDAIVQADNVFLREAKRIYTNSKIVSERLRKFNNITSEVLYPPLMDANKYRCGDFGNYLFYPSRITRPKRQHLAIESMRYVRSGVRLIVAGSPDTREDLEFLESLVKKYDLEDRVQVIGRWISQEEKAELFANALGCLYIPYDEDSYGYVTLESFHSKKPVITCRDSGGTLEMVDDGVNGFVAAAEAKELAEAMDRLMEDRPRAMKFGGAGYEKLMSMNISWDRVIKSLVQ